MAQIFRPSSNQLAKATLVAIPLLLGAITLGAYGFYFSSYLTDVNQPRPQPVPFSHEHHVRGLGIDCRYCHEQVETSAFAGIPPTKTCMTCHSQIWTNAKMLQPVRDSFATDQSLNWRRVNSVPDFVYFDHSVHVNNGVGCSTCHGQVDRMPMTFKAQTLHMRWCIDCHMDPAKNLRPADQIFNMDWQPPADQQVQGELLVKHYGVKVGQLTNCSICHR